MKLHASLLVLTLAFAMPASATTWLVNSDGGGDFGALDGKRIHTALLMLSPDVESHLQLLARASFALRDPELLRRLAERASPEAIFGQLDVVMRLLELRDMNR